MCQVLVKLGNAALPCKWICSTLAEASQKVLAVTPCSALQALEIAAVYFIRACSTSHVRYKYMPRAILTAVFVGQVMKQLQAVPVDWHHLQLPYIQYCLCFAV